MRADQVEVSWDAGKAKWLVRIVNGEEVIRRYCNCRRMRTNKRLPRRRRRRSRMRATKPMLP